MVKPVTAATAASCALTAHTLYNLRQLQAPTWSGRTITERVSVLIPARNEQSTIEATLTSVSASIGLDDIEIIVLDDNSSDDTATVVERASQSDQRITLIKGDSEPPSSWLGKPWAVYRLAEKATGSVLVFLDADVTVEPHGIAAGVESLRERGLAMVAPYPRQIARGMGERLIQPLVIWSWASTLPVGLAAKSLRPSLSAANGQMLICDTSAYHASGGHASVQAIVLEDIALMRSFKSHGYYCATVNGVDLAICRMYESTSDVIDGYSKSLWSAFGSPLGSVAVNSFLLATYVLPPLVAVTARSKKTRAIGAVGYLSGVAGRIAVARATGGNLIPDSLAHPASIIAFAGLNVVSWSRHLGGTNRWKGRTL